MRTPAKKAHESEVQKKYKKRIREKRTPAEKAEYQKSEMKRKAEQRKQKSEIGPGHPKYDYSTDRYHPYYIDRETETHLRERYNIRRELKATKRDKKSRIRPHYGSVKGGIPLLLLLFDGVLLMLRDAERPTLNRPVLRVLYFQAPVDYHSAEVRPKTKR